MENKNERYQQGKIYAIRSYQTDEIYIGSTCDSLAKRLFGHRNKINKCTSIQIVQYPDHYIELIELYPCNNRMELNKREGEIIRNHGNAINKNIPGIIKTNLDMLNKYYIDIENNILNWMNDICDINEKSKITPSNAYKSYSNYCINKTIKNILTRKEFKKHMSKSYKIIKISVEYYKGFDIKIDNSLLLQKNFKI